MGPNYDAMQYGYWSYAASTPQRLYMIAKIFGIKAKDYRQAKVLELGCAQGHNLIDLAAKYPQATFVGVDAAPAQIEIGRKVIAETKLQNIRLECLNITEIDARFGSFDYIIIHGIFSLVPEEVRQQIFKIIQHNLTNEGLAYISYNVLPGWYFNKVMRDLMLYNTRDIESFPEKVAHAKKVVKMLAGKIKGRNNFYAAFLQAEANNLLQLSNEKTWANYVGALNNPIYVSEFVRQAGKYALAYLSDTNIYNNHFRDVVPFTKNEIKDLLKINNYVDLMQQSDFLLNRQFRRTVLCRANQQINRNIVPGAMHEFYVRALGNISITNEQSKSLSASGIKSKDAAENERINAIFLKMIAVLNGEHGGAIQYNDLLNHSTGDLAKLLQVNEKPVVGKGAKGAKGVRGAKSARKGRKTAETKVKTGQEQDEQNKQDLQRKAIERRWFDKLLWRLHHDGYIELSMEANSYATVLAEKPMAAKLTRYYAAHFNFVINHRHESVKLENNIEKVILQNLDGTKTIEEIAAELLRISELNRTIFPAGVIKADTVGQYCKQVLEKFLASANLI